MGTKGKPNIDATTSVDHLPVAKRSNKRTFGNEITNVDLKRSRLNLARDKKPSKATSNIEVLKECNLAAQKQLTMKNSCVFGPFCPSGVTKVDEHVEEKCGRSDQDLESLTCSFRPQYHNQGLLHSPDIYYAHTYSFLHIS